uniref:Putative pi-ta protein n=1 Tax=Oryza sativa subsp. indica TaxID=39946 RepID=A0A679BAR6_ORYSI|nr:putative pi-ta protein [Oryza sativa Indica Group]
MEAPTCGLWGAVLNLPGRLDGVLLRHGSILPKGAEEEIPLIKRDLHLMISILNGYYSESPELEDATATTMARRRCWTKEVRELSYDIEDCIDHYEHAATAGSAGGRTASGGIPPRRKITRRRWQRTTPLWIPERLKQRLWMANKIREFSLRTQDALKRHAMFCSSVGGNGIATSTASSSTAATGDASSSSSTICWHTTRFRERDFCVPHVGINVAMNKLEDWLTACDDEDQKRLRVVSIVGVGGIGKTTLANELYRKLRRQFECWAFVRSSQKPDVRRILISILSQLRLQQPPESWKVHSLISSIRAHLQDKRYLIIVDDICFISTWDIIKCALPDGTSSSRVLTTTQYDDLAVQSCGYDTKYVFKMKSLSQHDSRYLFFNTVSGSRFIYSPGSTEVSDDIIRKCGSLPLAIVSITSILEKSRKMEQWGYVNKSLGYNLMKNPTLEGIKQVLDLRYNNLSEHLKPCVLYLSIYQEDYLICKDDLVNQWLAEGLICATKDHTKEEISEACFGELVSSKMIQPVHIDGNGDVMSFVIQHMVLNFIRYKSIEENFVTVIHHSQTATKLSDKVRRLSLHFGNVKDAKLPINMRLSQVRTLAFFGAYKYWWRSIKDQFPLLQVLILHFWHDEDIISFDLTIISQLFRLKYLKITSDVTLELQTKTRGLQCLETLKIDARISTAPLDTTHLSGLLHLSLPADTNLANGIGHMTSLHTFGYFDLSYNSVENVLSLGKLTNLRNLQLTCSTIRPNSLEIKLQCMGFILQKLSNLKSVTMSTAGSSCVNSTDASSANVSVRISGDGLSSMSSPPALVERLELLPRICIFSYLPKWISLLSKLRILKIGVRELVRNDIDVLMGLRALTDLSLHVHTKPTEIIFFGGIGFKALNLYKLKLGYNVDGVDQESTIPVGIQYLYGLKEISVKIGGADPEKYDRRAEELAFMIDSGLHDRCVSVTLQFVRQIFDFNEDKSSLTQEEQRKLKQQEILEDDSDEEYDEIIQDSGEQEVKQ